MARLQFLILRDGDEHPSTRGLDRRLPLNNPGRNTHGNGTWRNIGQYNRICADPRMGTDPNGSQYLGARSNIDMTLNDWNPSTVAGSDGYLLKNETVDANFCAGINDRYR